MKYLIPETQTAFLPGRRSAQNILIRQAVPQLLAKDEKGGLLGLCDFQKAYDTIGRQFLYNICKTLQMPTAWCTWISIILSNTRNRVNMQEPCTRDHSYVRCPVTQHI